MKTITLTREEAQIILGALAFTLQKIRQDIKKRSRDPAAPRLAEIEPRLKELSAKIARQLGH